nr:ABC-2 family transporter protein [uncultured Eisenbergiella sp.]
MMEKIKNNRKFVQELIRLRFQHLMMFRLGFWGPFFVDGSLFLVELLVFQAIYANVDSIGPWGKGEMVIFIGTFSLVNAVNMVVYFFGVNNISGKIRNGEIDLYLTKPISPLLRLSFEQVNPGSLPLVFLSICILWYGVRLSGVKVTPGLAAGYGVWVFLMIILWYEMEVIIRSLTFFVVSTNNITRLEEAGIDLCMKIPGVVFKGFYKLLFYVILPYGIIATFPAMYISGSGCVKMWIYGAAVVVVFGLLTAFLWKTGLKRYNSVSS